MNLVKIVTVFICRSVKVEYLSRNIYFLFELILFLGVLVEADKANHIDYYILMRV